MFLILRYIKKLFINDKYKMKYELPKRITIVMNTLNKRYQNLVYQFTAKFFQTMFEGSGGMSKTKYLFSNLYKNKKKKEKKNYFFLIN